MHILLSDQQRINRFARLNNRLEDLKEETKAKKNTVRTLEDAATDLMMLEDDEEKVNYVGSSISISFKLRTLNCREACTTIKIKLIHQPSE